VHAGVVVAAHPVTPRMRRVTVRSDAAVGLDVRPAQDIELLLREPSGRRVKRRYTIRQARPETGELDLDVLLHGDGPGARWGADARPGDAVEYQGPRGKLELRRAPWHLLIGDESALPAIAAITDALPPDEQAFAVIEVQDAADELPVAGETRWVHRGDATAGTADLLTAALAEVAIPAGARAYLMGESRAMVTLRSMLEERGIDHDAVFLKGYWNIGRPDRIAGRAPAAP
jgi:NADPH-dependent ferric siderophore reductase